jgi:hypothetical protein
VQGPQRPFPFYAFFVLEVKNTGLVEIEENLLKITVKAPTRTKKFPRTTTSSERSPEAR